MYTRAVTGLDARLFAASASVAHVVLVFVCEEFLDRQVMDAGVHQEVDANDLIEG